MVQYTLLYRYNIYKTAVRTKREYHDTKTKNKEVSSAMLSPVQIEYTCVFLIYHMRVYSAINSPVQTQLKCGTDRKQGRLKMWDPHCGYTLACVKIMKK